MNINLPPLGEGADSGTVVTVFVKAGDTITEGQTLLELENEKAIASIPASGAVWSAKFTSRPAINSTSGSGFCRWRKRINCAHACGRSTRRASGSRPRSDRADRCSRTGSSVAVVDTDFPEPVAAPVASPSIRRIARELVLIWPGCAQ
jgi:pyruvate/2-oxoglutarate dehydrogenase complex dihydrolipoamide acyltransferase (E2) component